MGETSYLTSCEDLSRQIGKAGLCVVDCRFDLADPSAGNAQYLDAHIPGAVFADLERDLSGPVSPGSGRHPLPDHDRLASTLGWLGISDETNVVCYDQHSGALAARLWWLLRWLGHNNARILDGGLRRWKDMGLPLDSGPVTHAEVAFQGSPDEGLIVHTPEILDSLAAGSLVVVDARDEERFSGRSEPIDPIAGHIPGAINVPFTDSLRDDGSWKTRSELARLWDDALGSTPDAEWCVMCGSGVTACHLVASALIAGIPEPRVYVGSWSEWITDAKRPIISSV